MAKPNYQFAKRQKELARQKKKEEKRLKKLEKKAVDPDGAAENDADESAEVSDGDTSIK